MKKLAVLAAIPFLFLAPAVAQGPTENLTIASGDTTHAVSVEIADTPEEIAKGLGGREALAAGSGMLLDMRSIPSPAPITMKGVAVELDLLFLAPDGKIVAIAQHARAGSLRPLDPGLRSVAVVQIAGGQAAELGIKPGDQAKHRIFGNAG